MAPALNTVNVQCEELAVEGGLARDHEKICHAMIGGFSDRDGLQPCGDSVHGGRNV